MKSVKVTAPTVITCHSNADWDALASMLGLSLLYPEAVLIFPGTMEKPMVHFFDEGVESLFPFKALKEIDLKSVKRVVLADTRQFSRVKHIGELLRLPGIEIHIWDHHPEPEPEDAVHAVVTHIATTGSTCTLICQALQEKNIAPCCEMATFLGLGIYADTGAFTYTSTTPEDYLAAAWLKRYGMDLPVIADCIQHDMTSAHIKILNDLIDSAVVHEVGVYRVVVTEVSSDGFLKDFAYLAQKFMEMESCHVLFALGEMDDRVQVVARSRIDAIDVGEICRHFGGGGHSFAASASVRNMSGTELKDAIFRQIFAQVHPDKRAKDLMSSPARGVEDNQSIKQAEIIMNRYGLKAAPVFRSGTHQCIGYMECQMASRAVSHGLGDMPISIYMQRNMLTVHPDASLQRLIEIIVGAHQRLIPVVEKNEVVGVVTRTDLINMFVEEPARIPIPQHNNKRERNLAKLLSSRLPAKTLNMLRLAGNLGDRLNLHVFAVGGFVRDLALSRPAAEFDDVDLVVEGDGIAFAKALAKELNGRVREHSTFMTALVIYQDEDGMEQRLDVATARLEYYQYPAALPTVELSSIKMDLFRRDFTINAMALRLNKESFGILVDFFGGQSDIQRKTIRVIHALSFVEDPTRIIRAVRFEQRYKFHISQHGEKLIKNALSLKLMEKLSGTRILHELTLIFQESDPPACLRRLHELGVLAAIHPDLALNPEKITLLDSVKDMLEWYKLLYIQEKPSVAILYMLALCSGVSAESTEIIVDRLGMAHNAKQSLLTLRQALRDACRDVSFWVKEKDKAVSQLCAVLAPLSLDGALYLMARLSEQEIRGSLSRYIYQWRHIRADITGDDLKTLGLPEGPQYGDVMRKVLAAKLDGIATTKEAQIDFVKAMLRQ